MQDKLPEPLTYVSQDLVTDGKENYPIVRGIIRLIGTESYASSFGLQWNIYQKTQLDSFTGTTINTDRLRRLAGGDLDIFKDKRILEAGCGAGAFTELMLKHGGDVFSVDLSSAVEANYRNCSTYPNYTIAQGNIVDLPFDDGQFDIVACIGVVQHTPSPEETMAELCRHVKPGGLLIMDHYTYGYPISGTAYFLRSLLLPRSANFSLRFVQFLTALLWPIHRGLKRLTKTRFHRIAKPLYRSFLRLSPMVDLQDAYPQLGNKGLREWMLLVTHDTLTDTYKHLRSAEEIENHLKSCGMIDIETEYAGNGVEARARKAER